ncbi:MAG: SAM-dependent methyltransferase [Cyclobacteriaceae bacterium]|nr:SAM-dependent methyltransferase [Cyclobacteriaceae bacterium]
MQMTEDILGRVLFDFLKHEGDQSILVHTSYGADETYDMKYFFRDFEDMPDLEQYALSLCSGRILDIGAGAGSHALCLQQQGHDVTAMDISQGCVNVMAGRGLRKVLHLDIYNMQEGGYNTLLLLMNGIGITGNLKGLVRFLDKAAEITSSRAQVIFDSTDVSYVINEKPGEKDGYPGEVEYQFEYLGDEGPWFEWLYVDQEKLVQVCDRSAWLPQIVYEHNQGHYLARLLKKY